MKIKELLKTYLLFCKIGAITFGGGYAILPILQSELVDKRGWLTSEKLADLYATAQCEPGPIAINISVLITTPRLGRVAGIIASLGVCTPSLLIILAIAALLHNFQDIVQVQQALAGIKVAVAALVVQIAWRMIKSGVKNIFGAIIFAAALLLLVFNVISAVFIILGAGAAGILFALIRSRKEGDA